MKKIITFKMDKKIIKIYFIFKRIFNLNNLKYVKAFLAYKFKKFLGEL